MNQVYTNAQEKLDMHGLKKIFIGGLIVFLHFRINGFDIIADFVGYIFMVSGLTDLSKVSIKYAKAKPIAIWLVILSLFSLYEFSVDGFLVLSLLFGLIFLALDLTLIHMICSTTAETALEYNQQRLAKSFKSCWVFIFVARIMTYIIMSIVEGVPITVIYIIAAVAAQIYYLVMLVKGYNGLNGKYKDFGIEESDEEKAY